MKEENIEDCFQVIEVDRFRFDTTRYFHIDFLNMDNFKRALSSLSRERRSPIFVLRAGDDTLNACGPDVESIYLVVWGVIVLRYYALKPDGDSIE